MRDRNPTPLSARGGQKFFSRAAYFTGRRWAARVCAHENEKTVLAMTPSCQSRLLAGSSEVPHPLPVFSIGRGSLRARGFGIGPPSQFELEMEKKSTHAQAVDDRDTDRRCHFALGDCVAGTPTSRNRI